jgi:hypothetical protein
MLLLLMTGGRSSEARSFRDLVRGKAVIVRQIVLLPVIGAAVTRGLALPPLGRGDFPEATTSRDKNRHPHYAVL